eukprot:CAMPEP_0203640096 /NCGR_PEP_ID=MMETSP0088-20131115/5669_1 /ASSEMBLY_ACC=CAM_ASM_001087 /TAXON_ID=426623 /ORGANISM="Chaetoceros affinis, Strain CCMP159" /LENGTH=39 /DNA_ID= /DNA_START= /DNA_END= /DNA_ORIENTATION=
MNPRPDGTRLTETIDEMLYVDPYFDEDVKAGYGCCVEWD